MKRFVAKIYDKTGVTFITSMEIVNDISITKTINGGLGPLFFIIPEKIDAIDDTILTENNHVKVYEQSVNAPSGRLIYSGYIDSIQQTVGGGGEVTKINLLGYHTRLSLGLLRSGDEISRFYSETDASGVVRGISNLYQSTEANPFIDHTTSTIPSIAVGLTYRFNAKTYAEALEICRERIGENYYWYVDETNMLYFKEFSTTADHVFTFGRDVAFFDYERRLTDVVNNLYFWNQKEDYEYNIISKRYYNSASESSYSPRWEKLTDGRVESETYADQLGEAYINANKDPNNFISFTVIDNSLDPRGVDISLINPGQTCRIANINPENTLGDNMVITRVVHDGATAEISVQDKRAHTSKEINKVRKSLDQQVYNDVVPDILATTSV